MEFPPLRVKAVPQYKGCVFMQCWVTHNEASMNVRVQALFLITTQGIPGMKEPHKWSPECKDFLSKCLAKDIGARPDAATLLKVPRASCSVFLCAATAISGSCASPCVQHPFMNKAGPPGCLLPGLRKAQKLKD